MKYCSECKKGEVNDEPALFAGTGTLLVFDQWYGTKRLIPWRANLCDGHCQVISENGSVNDKVILDFQTKPLR